MRKLYLLTTSCSHNHRLNTKILFPQKTQHQENHIFSQLLHKFHQFLGPLSSFIPISFSSHFCARQTMGILKRIIRFGGRKKGLSTALFLEVCLTNMHYNTYRKFITERRIYNDSRNNVPFIFLHIDFGLIRKFAWSRNCL